LIENIHISDFRGKTTEHLALGDGELDVRGFLNHIKSDYTKRITLELSPRWTYPIDRYLIETKSSLEKIIEVLG
jgi:sugar phosphate isomerase/epimerase